MSFVNPKKNKFGHFTVIAAVISLQLLLVILFEHSLSIKLSAVAKTSIAARLIEEFKQPPPPPPPPPPKPQKIKKIEPKPFVPKPEVSLPEEIKPEIQATTTIPVEAPVTHVQVSVPVVSHTPPKPDPVVIIGKLDASAGCDKPEYPQASLNAQEEGVVALSFLVDANNSVKESRVDKTSGYKRLDNAARDALSLCKFKAGTENGRPVASWVKIKYAWQLN